ncbi:MAG: septum formation initiator family protein [Candidatus Saccharimonadales bacterium]
MTNKIAQSLQWIRTYLASLRDVRNVGLLVFVIIVLLISWSGIKTIQTNYGLQKQISVLSQENQLQNLENTNLQLQNQYLNTNQYLELTARQNFGLGAPGETELLVPGDVAMAHTVAQPGDVTAKTSLPKQAVWQRNFEAWMNFLLHRPSAN